MILRKGQLAPADAQEIVPGLWVGSAPGRRAVRRLVQSGITCVVDLRVEAGEPVGWPATVPVHHHPLVEYAVPEQDVLDSISRRVASLVHDGATVLLHCRAGVQRAPMVACAVLMHMGWTLGDAYRRVSAIRPGVGLSDAQVDVLRRLGERPRRTSPPVELTGELIDVPAAQLQPATLPSAPTRGT